MKRYKLIGLTGQTGAGKSTAAAEFAALGAELVNADELVSALYAEDSPCVKTIAACFGAEIVGKDGGVDRRLLAQRAFSSKENTALLGRLVHPFVTAALFERLRGKTGIVIYDAPQRDRAPKCAYWMLVAVQGLTRPLLGDLAPEDAAALRRQLEKAYPRYARMPVQNELLRELKAAER